MNKDLSIDKETLEIAKVTFSFTFTRDEAEKFIHKPKSQVARKLRQYMCKIFEAAAKKMLESKPEDIVKECKVDIPDDLK